VCGPFKIIQKKLKKIIKKSKRAKKAKFWEEKGNSKAKS